MDASGTAVRQNDMLPSITHLNFDKVKGESPEFTRHTQPPLNVSTAPLSSPTNFHYSGPPPPYTYPTVNPQSGLPSPAESHRPTVDEKDHTPHRTSLPSIQEVINGDSKFPLAVSSAPPLQRNLTTSNIFQSNPPDVSSAPPITYNESQIQHQRQQHPQTTQSQHPPPVQAGPTHQSFPSSAAHASPYPPFSSDPHARSRPAGRNDFTAPRRRHSGVSISMHDPSPISPKHKQEPLSAGSTQAPYAFGQSYQPAYSFSAPPKSAVPHPPSFRPTNFETTQHAYPQRFEGPDLARVDESRKTGLKGHHGEIYGYSVRRHLDHFDLDSSLREVIQHSQYLLGGAENHLDRFKTAQSSGLAPVPVPTIEACDDMVRASQGITKTLTYMKDMLISSQDHHTAAEQASTQSFKAPTDFEDENSMYEDPKVGNGMGPDNKKRRARAAPPGRCHSCNRAETPEWRRGPDGARTLCNACGLHYAKLTRKTKNQSSMRPKSVDGSPP